jgi:hypothetical protein
MEKPYLIPLVMMISACSPNDHTALDESAEDMGEWSQRNPPVSETTWSRVDQVVCTAKRLDVCSSKGCTARDLNGKPPIIVRWLPTSGEYQRCDPNVGGCDSYTPVITYSGSFMRAALPANGLMFSLTASGEYREIATLATDTLIYQGSCQEQRGS